jgi:hypothetical protein
MNRNSREARRVIRENRPRPGSAFLHGYDVDLIQWQPDWDLDYQLMLSRTHRSTAMAQRAKEGRR